MPSSPADTYRTRLADRQARVARFDRGDARFAWARLVVFVAAAALVIANLSGSGPGWVWLFLPAGLFLSLVGLHAALLRRRTWAQRSVRFYERGLARLSGEWAGRGATGEAFADPKHPYAGDLDLFGEGSLFERLSMARTREGERVLADWLLAGADRDEILERQRAVDELRHAIDLREDLAVLADDVRTGVHSDWLRGWVASPPTLGAGWTRRVALALGVSNLVTLILWGTRVGASAGDANLLDGSYPFLVSAMVSLVFARWMRSRVVAVVEAAERSHRDLEVLSAALACVERAGFRSARLRELHARIGEGERRASIGVARLSRLVQLDQSRHNEIFRVLSSLVLLGVHLAHAMESWRARVGASVPGWLDALGEIEALASLGGYAFENPDDPFPEILEGEASFAGEALRHPLMTASECVPNDVRLGAGPQMLLVSGSNMSGKSTLLRTVGINAVLAMAGAPVRARALRMTPVAVAAAMRIVDSLQQGTSHFYAELKRLRTVFEIAEGDRTALFLLDEILHGTNSHDRRAGAEGLLRGLVERGAIGLVTTHDLVLTRIADELGGRARNVHFVDHLEGDRMVFDYTLRDGVVQKSNALALMRAVGLDV